MAEKERRFSVYDKGAKTTVEVAGKEALAKLLKLKVKDVPDIHLLKVTFGSQVVTELK